MQASWQELYKDVMHCERCELRKGCRNPAIGDGNRHSQIMLVGEGPGEQEDLQGIPFVGPAGKLLDKMLSSIELSREKVYICNVVKCRPPRNRTPLPQESEACLPYLRAQFVLTKPRYILCLGATAAKALIDPEIRITRARGQWVEKKGVHFLPTYHPAALLRDESKKHEAWEDLQSFRDKILADPSMDLQSIPE